MKSYTHQYQDLWVVEKTNGMRGGTFVEIGSNDPVIDNNTYMLEKDYGWTGIGMDKSSAWAENWKSYRGSPLVIMDATMANWMRLLKGLSEEVGVIDYLSLDVDHAQLEVVRNFPWARIRFQLLTVEHDSYRFGNEVRDEIRNILKNNGYRIDREDVMCSGGPFEDWWVAA